MKPNKNRFFCIGCKRYKMLFEEKKNADNFIRFNKDVILEESGKAPVRSYYCNFCLGWHVTSSSSLERGEEQDKKDVLLLEKSISVIHQEKILSLTISEKILEIRNAIFTSNIKLDIHKEYKCCKSLLSDLTHIDSYMLKSKYFNQLTMICDILLSIEKISNMELVELKSFISSLNSTTLKDSLIKRYAIGWLIDLSLNNLLQSYKHISSSKILKLKNELLLTINSIEGEGRKKFTQVYKSKIYKVYNKIYLERYKHCVNKKC